jgi:hypothetical protein
MANKNGKKAEEKKTKEKKQLELYTVSYSVFRIFVFLIPFSVFSSTTGFEPILFLFVAPFFCRFFPFSIFLASCFHSSPFHHLTTPLS